MVSSTIRRIKQYYILYCKGIPHQTEQHTMCSSNFPHLLTPLHVIVASPRAQLPHQSLVCFPFPNCYNIRTYFGILYQVIKQNHCECVSQGRIGEQLAQWSRIVRQLSGIQGTAPFNCNCISADCMRNSQLARQCYSCSK